MAIIDDVKEYYADLLILQYRNKPKARATIKLGVDIYTGDGVLFQLENILDIDTAVGAQLDLIGKILDCPRNIPGLVLDSNYFTFHVNSNSHGFSTVGNPSDGAVKTRANSNLALYALQDDDYRILLKFKAYVNRMRANMAEMDEALFNVFGSDVNLVNNKNLSITYVINNNTIPIQAARLLGYFKAPMGITTNFQVN